MSISYSGIIGNKGKATFPSVEGWGTDNNILRDPPKSITTRRIDKVNDDGSLNEMFYHSGDRFAENINVYARGVNPSVSVEYGNIGSFQGSNGSGSGFASGGSNAAPGKLPYRILDKGAFRPPILRMEQLYPLSRQPRLVTGCFTNKEFIDYTKKLACPSGPESYRQVRNETLKNMILPTKTVKFQEPVKEHFVVNYVIENPIHVDANINKTTKANLQQVNQEPLRQALKELNQYAYTAGIKGDAQFQNYIHSDLELNKNLPEYSTVTNKSSTYKETLSADHQHMLNRNVPIHMTMTNKQDKTNFMPMYTDDNLILERNIPEHFIHANKQQNVFTRLDDQGELVLERNVPEHFIQANKQQNVFTRLDDQGELVLERNVPEHFIHANKQQNVFTRLDDQGEVVLERNIPEHQISSKVSDRRTYISITPDNELSFKPKTSAGIVIPNSRNYKQENNNLNRSVNLPQALNIGGYDAKVSNRSQERNVNYNTEYKTQKKVLAESILEGMYSRDTTNRGVRS